VTRTLLLMLSALLLSACQETQHLAGPRLEGQVEGWNMAQPATIKALASNQPWLNLGQSTLGSDGRFQLDLRTPQPLELLDTELCDTPDHSLEAKVVSILGLAVEETAGKYTGLVVMAHEPGMRYGRIFYAVQSVTVTPECWTVLRDGIVLPAGWSVLMEDLTGQMIVMDTVPDDMTWFYLPAEP
jgi:hypothetical protein